MNHQRTIQSAVFEAPRGELTVGALMAMEPAAWEHLRSEINLRRSSAPGRPLARCLICQSSVYIKAQATAAGNVPLFAHYAEAEQDCPWYQGKPLIPDEARGAQYKGQQECARHRWMCNTIADVLRADPRTTRVTVDQYLKPTIEERGRYPDVFAEMNGIGRFAIEVQLSKPFAFEIAARHLHYRREGVSLIWVFSELADDLPQGFRDVITLQRGNAFVFDATALAASTDRGELMLSCYLEREGGWLKPRLAALTELDPGNGRSMFLEDRRTRKLVDYCLAGRVKWVEALAVGGPFDFEDEAVENLFGPCWDSIRMFAPRLSGWKDAWYRQYLRRARPHFLDVIAMLFSIQRTAETGQDHVYVTRYKGNGALAAMLNARLSAELYKRYSDLFETMLSATAARHLLDRSSLQTSLAKARAEAPQIAAGHPIWDAASRLFPEVYDGMLRAELADCDQLPMWAVAPLAPNAQTA
jgi:hypothetical protein